MSSNRLFIPVKITDKKWADKLMQGEVYMRSLHEFGSWGDVQEKDTSLKNNYRADFYSGVTAVFASPDDCKDFSSFSEDVKKRMQNCCYIDESDIQYFKIYSLYCYELNDAKRGFRIPDARMRQFGDTAVLIVDFCEFLERYAEALFARYPQVISLIDRVQLFDFHKTAMLNPLFCKHISQGYQNELRLAFGELGYDKFSIKPKESKGELVRNYNPVTLQIGNISDIAVEVPIYDFMTGRLPRGFKCRWPSNDPPLNPSNYDSLVQWTQDQMNNYHSIFVKAAFMIV